MPVSRHSPHAKKPADSSSKAERMAAARIALLLSPKAAKGRRSFGVIDAKGHRLELPTALRNVMHRAAELLAEGRPVAVLPDDEMLTTQDAASVLNVSRQYLVRLVDSGELPAEKVGSHRRLRAADVAAFKVQRDAKRASALDRLVQVSEDVGGYKLGSKSR
jgi:excisionase family DNA binding protein